MSIKADATAPSMEQQKSHGATFDGNLESLLDQIGQGLRADDATNFEKLNIARKYGPLLLQLKAIVPHGQFKIVLKERFPRVSYAKCNRWMVIARHEPLVAEALVAYPDVAWGPKKMIDYLTQEWRPKTDPDEDEEDCLGSVSDESINSAQLPDAALNASELDGEVEDGPANQDDESDERPQWEEFAANAESEARLAGKDPVVPTTEGTLTVTVFSQADHALIQDCLSKWELTSIPVYGSKDTSHLTVTLKPKQIPEILLQLGKTLKQSMPSQLKVTIEL